jgi:hypothetical protein
MFNMNAAVLRGVKQQLVGAAANWQQQLVGNSISCWLDEAADRIDCL